MNAGESEAYLLPLPVLATNDYWGQYVYAFDDTGSNVNLYGTFTVPQNYAGTPAIVLVWSAATTTGQHITFFNYRAIGGDDTESLDQVNSQQGVVLTDTAPSAAWERMVRTTSLTAANFAAGDTVQWWLSRIGSNGSDTLAATMAVFGLLFQYADA